MLTRQILWRQKFQCTSLFLNKLSTTIIPCSSKRESRFLNKIMNKCKPQRPFRVLNEDDIVVPSTLLGTKKPIVPNKRRMNVLNKLFMHNITDVMATGRLSSDLSGYGLEVTKVAISMNFDIINVFWVSQESSKKPELVEILAQAGITIRHELSQLRLMGQVPRINFIEDKRLQKLYEVDKLINIADLGPNETDEFEEQDVTLEEPLPAMSNNVYGLDHSRMMDKLLQSKQRAGSVRKQNVFQESGPIESPPSFSNFDRKSLIANYMNRKTKKTEKE